MSKGDPIFIRNGAARVATGPKLKLFGGEVPYKDPQKQKEANRKSWLKNREAINKRRLARSRGGKAKLAVVESVGGRK